MKNQIYYRALGWNTCAVGIQWFFTKNNPRDSWQMKARKAGYLDALVYREALGILFDMDDAQVCNNLTLMRHAYSRDSIPQEFRDIANRNLSLLKA